MPTGGTAYVNGYDVRRHLDGVRDSLGLCPQHDVLFDNMTVEEHLYFFGRVSKMPMVSVQVLVAMLSILILSF